MRRFQIANMNCGGCAKGVTATLRQLDPQARIAVTLDRREVAVETRASIEAMEQALRAAGWDIRGLPA